MLRDLRGIICCIVSVATALLGLLVFCETLCVEFAILIVRCIVIQGISHTLRLYMQA